MSKRHLMKVGDRVDVQQRLGVLIRVEPDEWYTVRFDNGEVKRYWRAVSYIPTEEEIAAACREIREGMSDRALESKAVDPRLKTHDYFAEELPASTFFGADVLND